MYVLGRHLYNCKCPIPYKANAYNVLLSTRISHQVTFFAAHNYHDAHMHICCDSSVHNKVIHDFLIHHSGCVLLL